MRNRKFTIDPGLSGTGWASWDKDWKLMDNGVVTSNLKDWKEKGQHISVQLLKMMENNCTEMYVEFPEFYQSAGGTTVAASGALVKLAWFVGLLSGALDFYDLFLVTPTEWKGQLPKDLVIKRIKKKLPGVKAKSHDWDAIGMGLYLRGEFK